MKHDIAPLLDKYKSKNPDHIFSDPDLGRDIEIIGNNLADADKDVQARARQFLLLILGEIETTIDQTTKDMKQNQGNIGKMQQISEACIAYLKPRGSNK